MKAEFIKRLEGWTGDARLYRLTPALNGFNYVVVSAASLGAFGCETMMFASNEHSEVESYRDLAHVRGALDHDACLQQAGYRRSFA